MTETYISLRRLENDILSQLNQGQIVFGGFGGYNPIQVSISQFYGIEINDFAVTVAKTALWIAESQMMKETENMEPVRNVEKFRLASQRSSTLRATQTPALFASIVERKNAYVAIPKVSSENRRYIPMDFLIWRNNTR